MAPIWIARSQKGSFHWVAEFFGSLVTLRVKIRYKKTLFGYGWLLLHPLGLTAAFIYILHHFVQLPTQQIPYPLFIALGVVPWAVTTLVVSQSPYCLTGYQDLMKRVAFPRILLPLATVAATGVDLAAMVFLLGALFVHYQIPLSLAGVGWSLILLGIHGTLLVGLSCFLSLGNVFLRDVEQAIPLLLQLWFFGSPVFYSSALVPEGFRAVIRWNPLTGLIEGYRAALLLGEAPSLDFLGPTCLVSLGVLALGLFFFWRLEARVTDFI